MKKAISVVLMILSVQISLGETINSKNEMRNLIKEINANSGGRFLITQNGVEVFFDANDVLNQKVVSTISGVAQESLIYGGGDGLNSKTPQDFKVATTKKLVALKNAGKAVFLVNYATGFRQKEEIKRESKLLGFVGETVNSFEANHILDTINQPSEKDVLTLNDVKSFLYILNPENDMPPEKYVEVLKNTNADLLIIEVSPENTFLTKKQIDSLKVKKNGKRRLVVAYFSIGEAEDYRYYWKKEWGVKKPNWIVKENPNWKGNYIVKFWVPEWKSILKDYQNKLNKMGIDGYYLDTIDTYEYFEKE